MRGLKIFVRLWESISAYLPVLLMLIFAMFTYWLLQITPKSVKKEQASAKLHVEDYFMKDFKVTTYKVNGEVKTQLVGQFARHFEDTDTFEIDQPRLYSQTIEPSGRKQKSEGVAKLAIGNSDASIIELKGDVIFNKEEFSSSKGEVIQTSLKSEYLKINSDLEEMNSNLPVQIERGHQKITGDSMSYNNLERHLIMSGHVKAIFDKK
jgi:lipopolysaccharide export system protein LptC